MLQDSARYSVQTIEKSVALLKILAWEGAQPLQTLADRLKISRSKAFRIAMTLENLSLIRRAESEGAYDIGMAALELAQKVISNSCIIRLAHPVMEDLARKHGEAVYLTVADGEEVFFLDMVDCRQVVKAVSFVGKRFPLFVTAAGKVIKAQESSDLRERRFNRMKRYNGLPDFSRFESELDVIRQSRVAIDSGALGEGIISVAVAIRDYAGKVIGAITLLGPSFRLFKERLEDEIIPSLTEGADLLSGKFGYARI